MRAIDLPPSLSRSVRRIIEILIRRLKEPKMQVVHFLVGNKVGTEQNAIGVFDQKFPRGIWLTSELCDTRPDIDMKVRGFIEQPTDICQILGFFRQMCANKSRFRMPLKN